MNSYKSDMSKRFYNYANASVRHNKSVNKHNLHFKLPIKTSYLQRKKSVVYFRLSLKRKAILRRLNHN